MSESDKPKEFKLGCSDCSTSIENIQKTLSRMTPEASKILAEGFKETGLSIECYLCLLAEYQKLPPKFLDAVAEASCMNESEPIQFEEITIKVPNAVMDLLRFSESVIKQSPKEFIEWSLVEAVRSQIDSNGFLPDRKALTDKFNLNPVFKEILNDQVS